MKMKLGETPSGMVNSPSVFLKCHHISDLARALGIYCQQAEANGNQLSWPDCPDIPTIQSSLGVFIGGDRITSAKKYK